MAKLTFKVWDTNGQLADATSVVFSSRDGVYGWKRNDLGTTVVAAGTDLTRVSAGTYEYEFTPPVLGISYTGWIKTDVDSREVYYEVIHNAPPALPTVSTSARAKRIYSLIQRQGIDATIRLYPFKIFDPTTNKTVLGAVSEYSIKITPPYQLQGGFNQKVLITSGKGLSGIPAFQIPFVVTNGMEIEVVGKKWSVTGNQPVSDSSGVLYYQLDIVSS